MTDLFNELVSLNNPPSFSHKCDDFEHIHHQNGVWISTYHTKQEVDFILSKKIYRPQLGDKIVFNAETGKWYEWYPRPHNWQHHSDLNDKDFLRIYRSSDYTTTRLQIERINERIITIQKYRFSTETFNN